MFSAAGARNMRSADILKLVAYATPPVSRSKAAADHCRGRPARHTAGSPATITGARNAKRPPPAVQRYATSMLRIAG